MTKTAPIKSFTPAICRSIREALSEAITPIAKELGV
ncbi:unnamed protein product, partial [marine sediment metagenome]